MTIDTSKIAALSADVEHYDAEYDRSQQAVNDAFARSAASVEIRALCERRDRDRQYRESALMDLAEAVRAFLGAVQ